MAKERIQNVMKRLENGIRDVFESEHYTQWLDVLFKFYNYSYFNTILILWQNPDASQVAGFNT